MSVTVFPSAGVGARTIQFAVQDGIQTVFSPIANRLSQSIFKQSLFNVSITANTNIFTTDIITDTGIVSIAFLANAAGNLTLIVKSGANTMNIPLNNGLPINANEYFTARIQLFPTAAINLQYSSNATATLVSIYDVL